MAALAGCASHNHDARLDDSAHNSAGAGSQQEQLDMDRTLSFDRGVGGSAGSTSAGPARDNLADAAGSATGVTVASASREGSTVTLVLESPVALYGIWAPHCSTAPRLLKSDAEQWVTLQDDRPQEFGEGYYLDGTYEPNQSLGCDGGDPCYERDTMILSTLQYVQTGTQSPPDDSQPAAAGADGQSLEVPVIESRDTAGPYVAEITYRPGACDADPKVIRLAVPVN
jgi:hypothetical protein